MIKVNSHGPYPVVTLQRLTDLLGVSKQAASTAARQLSATGVLKEKTGFKRNKVFVAEEVLKIYNRPA